MTTARSALPHTSEPAADDLQRAGFTDTQIASIRALRERYPHWEFVTSRREWNYLLFARWENRQGRRRD